MEGNTEELLEKFLSDSNVRQCMPLYQESNIFNLLELDEIRHSRILSWLLNTKGSHNAGDFFIRELLHTAKLSIKDDRKLIKGNDFFDEWSLYNVETYDYSSSIITTELRIDNTSNSSRIDLAIFCPHHQFMIFIENKTGSNEHSGQLETYRTAFSALAKKLDWHIGFIYMDWSGGTASDESWVSIDYEWLTEALKTHIIRNISTSKISNILKDYHDYLADGIEPFDSSIAENTSLIASIANTHEEFLTEFQKDLDYSYPTIELLKRYFAKGFDFDKFNEGVLYWQNYPFFDALSDINYWDLIQSELKKRLTPESDYTYQVGEDLFYVHKNSWKNYYGPDYQNQSYWIIQLRFRRKDEQMSIVLNIRKKKLEKAPEAIALFCEKIDPNLKNKSSLTYQLSDKRDEQVDTMVRLIKRIDNNIHLLGKD